MAIRAFMRIFDKTFQCGMYLYGQILITRMFWAQYRTIAVT